MLFITDSKKLLSVLKIHQLIFGFARKTFEKIKITKNIFNDQKMNELRLKTSGCGSIHYFSCNRGRHLTENLDLRFNPQPPMPAIFQPRLAKKINQAHSVRVIVNLQLP